MNLKYSTVFSREISSKQLLFRVNTGGETVLFRPPEQDLARPFPTGTGDFDLVMSTST